MQILSFSNNIGKMCTLIAVQKWSVFPAYSKVMLVTPNYKNGEVETGVNEYDWVCVKFSSVINFS